MLKFVLKYHQFLLETLNHKLFVFKLCSKLIVALRFFFELLSNEGSLAIDKNFMELRRHLWFVEILKFSVSFNLSFAFLNAAFRHVKFVYSFCRFRSSFVNLLKTMHRMKFVNGLLVSYFCRERIRNRWKIIFIWTWKQNYLIGVIRAASTVL